MNRKTTFLLEFAFVALSKINYTKTNVDSLNEQLHSLFTNLAKATLPKLFNRDTSC
ncbi:MAG: hypothetical protein IT215_04260 [Chitinophagaceae bacterium]|nr:hypothetical protein [Chitinophagaceae bacterium]